MFRTKVPLDYTDNDLRKVTQMVEAAGITVRYPLLHRDLVDFTTTIPPTIKVKTGKKSLHIQTRHERVFAAKDYQKDKTRHGTSHCALVQKGLGPFRTAQ